MGDLMNEKMRKEFEAWYLAEMLGMFGESVRGQVESNMTWLRDDGSFADPMLRLGLMAWQASREALVIELPGACECCHDQSSIDMNEACAQAIEAAGLKVQS